MAETGLPLLIERGGSIDWIVLNGPDQANALSARLLDAFSGALAELAEEGAPPLKVANGSK